MKRIVVLRPAAERAIAQMDRATADRIVRALAAFAADGPVDVKALKGELKGKFRLRVGKWRAIFSLDLPGTILVFDIDNRGQAY